MKNYIEELREKFEVLDDTVKKIELQINLEASKKKELQQKKYDSLRAGAGKTEVTKIDKDLKEVNDNLNFLLEQKEVVKEMVLEDKKALILEVNEIRKKRMNEMRDELKAKETELEKLKLEYFKAVHETYSKSLNEMRTEMSELNDLIHDNKAGVIVQKPREVFKDVQVMALPAPDNKYQHSPFVKEQEMVQVLSPLIRNHTMKLFFEFGEYEKDNHKARLRYEALKKKGSAN